MAGLDGDDGTRFWRLDGLGVEAFRRRSPADFPKHSHDEWQVSWGVDRWWHRDAFHEATAGDLVVIPPGEVHATHLPGRPAAAMKSFYIADAALRDLAGAEGRAAGEAAGTTPVIAGPRLVARFTLFWRVATASATALERTTALGDLVEALAIRGATARAVGVEPRGVARAREFLHAYPTEEVPLADLAGLAGLSPCHLNRAFRRAVGVPPHAYQVQLRVRKVKALLAEGASIVEAVGHAGFADQSHLGRHFKRLVALSPGEYRRAALAPGAGKPGTARSF